MMTTVDRNGALAANVMLFARILRYAGLPIGPGKILTAIDALAAIDVTVRADVYWTLHAILVERHSQTELYQVAFEQFWAVRSQDDLDFSVFDSDGGDLKPDIEREVPRRVAEAMANAGLGHRKDVEEREVEFDSAGTWSAVEQLRSKDFESMSTDELAATRRAMRRIKLPIPELPSRRFRPHSAGRRIDMRATLRGTVRSGGGIDLKCKKRTRRHPPLVVLCDISGSMEAYARMLLHFLHAVTNDQDRVHTFLFGTRLTNVTHHLSHTDPDVALRRVGEAVQDWSGGTRIGDAIATFNRQWSRRVLGQGAVVLLISDGLDRDGGDGLGAEMERLQKSCRRLIWLNPLLRFDGFEPKSAGVRAMLPYVDEFRAVHNLNSLTSLADALSQMGSAGRWHPDQKEGKHA